MAGMTQPSYPVSGNGRPAINSSFGVPADNYHSSLSAGPNGPLLLGDIQLLDKLAHFDRERIPERVVHAKGAGAHGYFEVTHDIRHYCKAKFLDRVGKRTPVFTRFSTVGYEKGSADSFRDPRGFAIKFYTEEGNWDMVGNNTPVFFIRDGMKFPDFIHTQKKNPGSNLPDPDAFWDFLSLEPESVHQVMILFSDRGTPDGFRHMNGYGSHSYKMVNSNGEVFYVKFHFKTNQGIKNFTAEEASKLGGIDPDYATRDLYNSIARGESPSWNFYIQVMSFEKAKTYRWNVLDVTKVWPHKDYPLIPVGKLCLNRNPENYFAETEQSAFSPAHLVPGIEPSEDKMLQSRLFSYTDTHRHRLGPNYHQIPINSPWNATSKGDYNLRDGPMTVDGNKGNMPNYAPNSHANFPASNPEAAMSQYNIDGLAGRYTIKLTDDDFVQPRQLFQEVMDDTDRDHLISNIAGHLKNAKKDIQERQCHVFARVDPELGKRIAHAIGLRPLSLKASF